MHPLPLLDVHRPAGGARRLEQVGLAAEEGRDLQHVRDLRDGGALLGQVHVGEHGQPVSCFTRASASSPCSIPGPRVAPGFDRLALSKLAL
jgi:hypothetical protein